MSGDILMIAAGIAVRPLVAAIPTHEPIQFGRYR